MKINYIKSIIAASIFALASSSCDVERLPYNVIDDSQSFNSVSDASYWNKLIYSQLRGRVYGTYTISTDVQADQLNASADYGNRNGSPHRWDFNSSDGTLSTVWSGYYGAIANINRMLLGFETITPENPEEEAELNSFKGDAHLARAYYYFNLVNRFGKIYTPSSASSDLGVPIVEVPDVNNKPARNTVQEVYSFVLTDLERAKSLLSNKPGSSQSTYFNGDVVLALEARVKLYMQDFEGARAAAESLINSGNYPLYSTADEVRDMWHKDLPGEDIFSPVVNMPNESPNTNSIYLGYNLQNDWYTPDFLPSQWVVDEFADEDFRKGAYFLNTKLYLAGGERPGFWVVNKYPGNADFFTTAATNYVHRQKVFRIGEMYLIAAEAAFRASNSNPSLALTHLNTLRAARGLTPLSSSLNGNGLFEAIKLERFKELAFEGFRLDDLRRWNEGFSRRQPQDLVLLNNSPATNFTEKSVSASDDKFTWGIPVRDQTVNTNIIQNPGW